MINNYSSISSDCEKLLNDFEKDRENIKSFWWTDVNDKGILPEYELGKHQVIINKININSLISVFEDRTKNRLNDKSIVPFGMKASKICQIASNWKNKVPLLPPFIFYDQSNKVLNIADGQHRFHVADIIGNSEIPIIVTSEEWVDIVLILKMDILFARKHSSFSKVL